MPGPAALTHPWGDGVRNYAFVVSSSGRLFVHYRDVLNSTADNAIGTWEDLGNPDGSVLDWRYGPSVCLHEIDGVREVLCFCLDRARRLHVCSNRSTVNWSWTDQLLGDSFTVFNANQTIHNFSLDVADSITAHAYNNRPGADVFVLKDGHLHCVFRKRTPGGGWLVRDLQAGTINAPTQQMTDVSAVVFDTTVPDPSLRVYTISADGRLWECRLEQGVDPDWTWFSLPLPSGGARKISAETHFDGETRKVNIVCSGREKMGMVYWNGGPRWRTDDEDEERLRLGVPRPESYPDGNWQEVPPRTYESGRAAVISDQRGRGYIFANGIGDAPGLTGIWLWWYSHDERRWIKQAQRQPGAPTHYQGSSVVTCLHRGQPTLDLYVTDGTSLYRNSWDTVANRWTWTNHREIPV